MSPELIKALHASLSSLQKVGGVIKLELQDGEGEIVYIDTDDGSVSARPRKPQLIACLYERDLLALLAGSMSAADGILTDRLRLTGDAARIARFNALFDQTGLG
jgi:hypothetical protein